MLRTAIIALALMASPAQAATLWQNVEVGMTVDQLRALFPEQKGRVEWHKSWLRLKNGAVKVGKCKPLVEIDHSGGAVRQILVGVYEYGGDDTCDGDAYQAMLSKYGKPDSEVSGGPENGTITSSWVRDGVGIEMIRHPSSFNAAWSARYRPVNAQTGL